MKLQKEPDASGAQSGNMALQEEVGLFGGGHVSQTAAESTQITLRPITRSKRWSVTFQSWGRIKAAEISPAVAQQLLLT